MANAQCVAGGCAQWDEVICACKERAGGDGSDGVAGAGMAAAILLAAAVRW